MSVPEPLSGATQSRASSESRPGGGRRRAILILTLVAFALILAAVSVRRGWINPASAAAWLESVADTWWAPLVFVLLYIVFNILALPGTPLTLTAGVVWGWLTGGLWVLLGSTVGSLMPYLIARSGAPWVEEQVRRRAGHVYEKLQHEGFITLLLMRLVPIFPYNVLNYASGLAGIRLRHYVVATFIGTIPGIFIYTYLADSLKAGALQPRDAFVRILIAGVLLAVLALGTRLLAGRVRRRLD